jgi:hypothetical protein
MATSIDFTDSIGSATLSNSKADGPDRFGSWTPWQMPVGPKANSLATGQLYRWTHRTDYGARFELRHIPNSSLDVAMRLIAHLENGGTCTVNTGDASARTYTTCGLAPDADLGGALSMSDPKTIEYTLSLSLINLGAAQMLCVYP